MKLILSRDGQAVMSFEEVYEEHKGFLHMKVQKWRGLGIEYDDLFQIAAMKLWQAYQSYDARKGFKFTTYAARFVDNGMLGLWKHAQRRKGKITICSLEAENKLGYSFGQNIAAPSINITLRLDFRDAVKQLTCDELNVMNLVCAGYKWREIEKIEHCSSVTISRRLKRARRKLESVR